MTFKPEHLSRWTRPDNYMGAEWPKYYSAPVGQHRDSDTLSRSNFSCMLRDLGGESETVLVIRESHWAVGWVEWIAIHESDTEALRVGDTAAKDLEDYPVLDETHWSELEQDEANEVWQQCYTWQERVNYIKENRSQFEPYDWPELRACVKGELFLGYANELPGVD